MRRGFTLFEVLLALAIVVVLMASLASTLTIAFRAKASAENAVLSVRDVQTVGDIWAREVTCTLPPSPFSSDPNGLEFNIAYNAATQADPNADIVVASGGINGMQADTGNYLVGAFIGSETDMQFYTSGAPARTATPSGVIFVQYYLAMQQDGNLALVRRANTNLLAEDTDVGALTEEVLILGVKAIQFQYYDGLGWEDQWDTSGSDNGNQLPYAVRMILTLNPLREGGQDRVITRVAPVWCAQKTVNDYQNAVNASDSSTTAPGIAQ